MASKTKSAPKGNGKSAEASVQGAESHKLDPAVLAKIAEVRQKVNETFGKVALAMMASPRYRHMAIGDLSHLLLDPLIRDRVAIAQAVDAGPEDGGLAGIAIWASVSEDADTRIREQIKAGVFPLRLKPDDWNSGQINWLIDVIAPSSKAAASVLANFKQVVKEGDLRIHPQVTRVIDPEILKKMGAGPMAAKN